MVPDELHGSILTKTLPARPHMTTKEVCKIIAHKARITNPQDYALYRLVDGEGKYLLDIKSLCLHFLKIIKEMTDHIINFWYLIFYILYF